MLRKWHEIRGIWFPGRFRCSAAQGSVRIRLEYRWEDPTSPRHIRTITVAKGLHHHSLFSCDAAKEQNPKTGQARKAGDPIRQQQSLGNSPEPKCRIHRVSNSPVNPVCHEFMILPYVEADGPIPAKRTVRQVKHTE